MSKQSAAVTDTWTVTIPKHVREFMGLQKGERIEFIFENGKIYIKNC